MSRIKNNIAKFNYLGDVVTPETAQEAVDSLATPPPEDGGYDEYIAYFNKSSEGMRTLIFGKDARTTAAILKARLTNMKKDRAKYAKMPVVGKLIANFLNSKIRVMEAEYNAVVVQAEEEQYSANTRMILSTLAVGLGLLASFTLVQHMMYTKARTDAIKGG